MKYLNVLIFVAATMCADQPLMDVSQKPNILFILADDCTVWDIGTYVSADAITPNIDKLASEGIKFENCYQASPMCSPTRHNLFTGLYPVKSGAYPNHTNAYSDTKSIVHYLQPLGYRVALSGKKHIGPKKVFPFEYLSESKFIEFDKVENFLADCSSDGKPFALMLTSNEPHTPWNKGDISLFNRDKVKLPPHFVDTKETREAFCTYLAEINYLDGQVGKAMDLLQKYNLENNTMVVFASEQGNSFPFAKWTLYEAGVKSALIARFPPMIKSNSKTNSIVEYSDILPTFIALAGGDVQDNLDGKSLIPIMKGEKDGNKKYSYSLQTTRGINDGSDYFGIRAIVNDQYRYIWNLTPEVKFLNVINNKKKPYEWYQSWLNQAESDPVAANLVRKYAERPAEELYDIKKDKWCLDNLAEIEEYTSIKSALRTELLKWMEACGDKGQETELNAYERMPNRDDED